MRTQDFLPRRFRRGPAPLDSKLPRQALIPALVFLLLLAGCSSDTGSPSEPGSGVAIGGASLPDVLLEGETATISVWGTSSEPERRVESLDVRVLREPGEDPGRILVSVMTGQTPGGMRAGGDFSITIDLPALAPGDYVVEIAGSNRTHDLTVFSRGGWIWYRAIGDPRLPDEGLHVSRDGRAMAFREGGGRPAHVQLEPREVEEITGWFREAHFADLEDTYLGDEPSRGRLIEVALKIEEHRKRVLADEALAPENLKTLVGRLSGLVARITAVTPGDRAVAGRLEVEPPAAEAGSPRTLRLTLMNHGRVPVTLTFPTAQLYDLQLVMDLPPGSMGPDHPGPNGPHAPQVLIWNWAHGRAFPQVITELRLEPGESKTFEEAWNGLSNDGRIVGPGAYRVDGMIPVDRPVPVRAAGLIVRGPVPGPHLKAELAIRPMAAPRGTERELVLYVTNPSDVQISVTFGSTKQYDFGIEDPRSERPGFLWLWSHGRGFGDMMITEVWEAGETKVFRDVWNGKTNDGAIVEPGVYLLSGWLASEGADDVIARAHPVRFGVARE